MEPTAALALGNAVNLDLMANWSSYEKERQERLRQYAGEIREAQWEQGFATLKEAAALFEAKKELTSEGEFRGFLDQVYKQSWRTGYERLNLYERARQKLSEEQIAYLAAYGRHLMPYPNVPMGEFINAAKGLPAPKSERSEDMDPFIEKVGVRYKELKSERRKNNQKKVSAEDAAKEAFNALLHLISSAKIKTTQRQIEFLERVAGMVMTDRAIPNQLAKRLSRVEVPQGFKVKRGRPPLQKNSSKRPGGGVCNKPRFKCPFPGRGGGQEAFPAPGTGRGGTEVFGNAANSFKVSKRGIKAA